MSVAKKGFSVKRFIEIIGSRRFAIWLLLATTAVIFLSNLLPKPYVMTDREIETMKRESPILYQMGERFNVGKVTKSPVFGGIAIFLFASITVCTARRVRIWAEERERKGAVPETARLPIISTILLDGSVSPDAVEGIMAGNRWRPTEVISDAGRILYARKGGEGFWGSAVFHAGMCVVLAGALVSAVTRYNGRLVLTQDFGIDPAAELRGLTSDQRYVFPLRGMMLDSFNPIYEGVFPVDYIAEISGLDLYGREFRKSIRVNEPMSTAGYNFLLTRYGYAPRFAVKDSSGRVVSDDVVNLAVITPETRDSFNLLKGSVTARVSFFPDFYIDAAKGMPASRSRNPNNPVFLVTLERPGGTRDGGFLPIGKGLDFGGYTLEFKELRYWVQLDVSKDAGVPLVTIGFFVIISGLAVRMVLNEKAVWIIIKETADGTEVGVGGRARFFPALFEEEIKRLAGEIRAKSGVRSQESEG